MPCRVSPEEERWYADQSHQSETAKLQDQINQLEAMLCALMTRLTRSGHHSDSVVGVQSLRTNLAEVIGSVPAESGVTNDQIVQWFYSHHGRDVVRRANERKMLRENALAKLTEEEKKELGLA